MAEASVLVCDYCGKPAADTLTFRVNRQNLLLDVCERHLSEITSRARRPKRGRKPKNAASGGRSK
jgi:hypothetical protein